MWIDFDDKYAVSEEGLVMHKKSGRVTKGAPRKQYNVICSYNNNIVKAEYVHRMVAHCFLPRIDIAKLRVDHINRDKRDNRACNLRWVPNRINILNTSRKTSSGHRNIYITRNDTYRVAISYTGFSYQKQFKTLDEAISARDNILAEYNMPV